VERRADECLFLVEKRSKGKNRIMIFGPKTDDTYVVEFRTSEGDVLAISIPRTETAVIRHFQERMPYGLFVPGRNC
jgi:hypothetical protein